VNLTDKQLLQITENLKKKQNLKALPTAIASRTSKPDVDAPPCKCGKPRKGVWFELMGRYIHIALCDDCEAKQELVNVREARIEKAAKFKRMLRREIPELYLDAKIRDITKPVLAMIKSREPGQGIFLWGKVGRGKTYIASAVMRHFIVNGKTAKRARFRDITHEIQKTYDGAGSAEMVLGKYVTADLLSIEDVGTGKAIASEFDIETLLKLIDKRMEAKKTTIITSNKNMEGMADTFDTRIFSRLQTFVIIEMTGQDRRKK